MQLLCVSAITPGPFKQKIDMDWLSLPHIHLPYIAFQMYGNTGRLYTRRLQMKVKGIIPLEPWEVAKLEVIRQEIASQLTHYKTRHHSSR